MTLDEILKKLTSQLKDLKVELIEGAKNPVTGAQVGDSALAVPADRIKEICNFLKKTEGLDFDCLSNLTAIDRKDRFEVVYHLFSYPQRHSVVLKATLPRDETAHLETVEEVWPAANWLEREVFDLFGIKFDNHSDLRRIMLPDDWNGHPLRKDYKEEEDYHGITTTRTPLLQ